MIRSAILDPEFNINFPYQSFPWRLDLSTTVCHFECEEHLQKYLDRYKLKPKDYKVSNRDGKSLKSSKKYKTNVPKRSGSGDNRSTGTVRKRKSSVDSSGNTSSNAKGAKCLRKSKTKN
jgi:hypothetical protein